MKKWVLLIIVLFLVNMLTVGCAGGSGGGTGGSPTNPHNPNQPTDPEFVDTYDYTLVVSGVAGTQFASSMTVNFGDSDQNEFAPGIATLPAGGVQFPLSGRNILVQVVQRSTGALQYDLYKDGVLIDSRTTTTDAQGAQMTDGL